MFVKKIIALVSSSIIVMTASLSGSEHPPGESPIYIKSDIIDSSQPMPEHLISLPNENLPLRETDLTNCEIYFCIAKSEGLSLYACRERETGVICLLDDHAQYFDWQYQTPRQILPRITMLRDGFYACVLNVASGTGVQLSELHLLKLDNGQISDSLLSAERISEEFESILTDISLSAHTLSFKADGKAVQTYLDEYREFLTLSSVSCGQSINEISTEDGLTVRAAVELHTEELLGPVFVGTLQADICVENNIFQFSNFVFIPE